MLGPSTIFLAFRFIGDGFLAIAPRTVGLPRCSGVGLPLEYILRRLLGLLAIVYSTKLDPIGMFVRGNVSI